MLAYVGISAATVFYLGKVIILKNPAYLLGSFFALLTLLILAPAFMSFFPPTVFATTGEAAIAQMNLGTGVQASQMFLSIMPVIAAGTLVAIAAGRAKTTIELILLSLTSVMIAAFIAFALLVIG